MLREGRRNGTRFARRFYVVAKATTHKEKRPPEGGRYETVARRGRGGEWVARSQGFAPGTACRAPKKKRLGQIATGRQYGRLRFTALRVRKRAAANTGLEAVDEQEIR